MKKQFFSAIFIACILFVGSATVDAQAPLSFSGQFGYALPQGSAFETADGENMTRFGLGVDADALWHFPQTNYRLGVGIAINSSLLFGADLGGGFDMGLFALNLYGVRGYYRFLNSRVSPFGALTLGLAQFGTPEMTFGSGDDAVVVPSRTASGFGIRPEIGVEFGRFIVSVGYTIPMSYTINDVDMGTAGSFQFTIGTRISMFNRN